MDPTFAQMTALQQYPESGVNIPQVLAIQRARMGGKKPLYASSGDVMGGAKPMQEAPSFGGQKPMGVAPSAGAEPVNSFGAPKPMGPSGGMRPPEQSVSKYDPNARIGRPGNRSLPGKPGMAPVVRNRIAY